MTKEDPIIWPKSLTSLSFFLTAEREAADEELPSTRDQVTRIARPFQRNPALFYFLF